MNIEDSKNFPLRGAYEFANAQGLAEQAAEIREMEIDWYRERTSEVRRGLFIRLFEKHNLMPQFIAEFWPFGTTARGEASIRAALQFAYQYDDFISGDSDLRTDVTEGEPNKSEFEFALEAHLRDFLARNLSQIEPGLTLFEAEARTGIEYPVDQGRIDILALDREGHPVVIELKLTQGRNKALGQLLYYMGWIDQHLGRGPCRGVVIASDISNELTVAVSRVPGVALYRYKMNFSLEHSGGRAA